MRIGHGYDAHRFTPHRPLVLGGVTIPYERGMLAYSDGDVLIHALCDALLGAAGLGDIGAHFPHTDPSYRNIDSRILLRHVIGLLWESMFSLANADLTVLAETPKLAPYIDEMRERLASDLGLDKGKVNIKATTTEGMGFVGRGEGIAAHAVVLLEEK